MATVVVKTLLDECPAEVQAYFEQQFKVWGTEAQISRLKAKRSLIAVKDREKRSKLAEENTNLVGSMIEARKPLSEAQVGKMAENVGEIKTLDKKIKDAVDKAGCGRKTMGLWRDAHELYGGDAQTLAAQITGWKVQPMDKIDPSVLKRIEELRKERAAKARSK